jgi:hypothetical protein
MNSKERFDFKVKNGLLKPDQDVEIIDHLANRLIEALYRPTKENRTFTPNGYALNKYNIDADEPINWGDLKANVLKENDYYLIVIDEAAPDDCPTLCEYIEKYLTAWGWDVKVITEW